MRLSDVELLQTDLVCRFLGRRDNETIHALRRPASEKRQGIGVQNGALTSIVSSSSGSPTPLARFCLRQVERKGMCLAYDFEECVRLQLLEAPD